MNIDTEKTINDALHLPLTTRAFLAEKLLESIDTDSDFELSDEWKAELDRRCREVDQGRVTLIPADDVFQEAFRRLG